MSKLKVLGEDVALTGDAAQTAVEMDETPFAPGFNAVAVVSLAGPTGTPTVLIEGSDDNSTFTTLLTVTDITQLLVMEEVTLKRYMRVNVTEVGSAGTVTAYLLA